MSLSGRIDRAHIPLLCARLRSALGAAGPAAIICDVRAVDPDGVAVDALARLQLAAKRLGCEFRLRYVPADLRDLLVLVGMCGVLREEGLAVEPQRQAEEREEPRRVEEEGDAADRSR